MKAVLITGTRRDGRAFDVCNLLNAERPDLVIQGGATGADSAAKYWANSSGTALLTWPDEHWGGHVTGPTRNGYMVQVAAALLAAGWDVAVHAFPAADSRGTWSCVRQAEKAGLDVAVHQEAGQ